MKNAVLLIVGVLSALFIIGSFGAADTEQIGVIQLFVQVAIGLIGLLFAIGSYVNENGGGY